jgi:hypothetical protein
MDNIQYLVDRIEKWLENNKIGKTSKKRTSIARDIFWIVFDSKLTLNDIEKMEKQLRNNPFEIDKGNIWEHLYIYFDNKKYCDFFTPLNI